MASPLIAATGAGNTGYGGAAAFIIGDEPWQRRASPLIAATGAGNTGYGGAAALITGDTWGQRR